jgi:hypothetical protein
VRRRRHVENPQFSWRPVEGINPRPTFNGPQRSAVLKRLMAYIYARNTRLRKANDGLSTGIKKRYSLSPLGLGFVVVTFYQIAEGMPGRVTNQREHDYKAEEERNEAEQHRAGNQCCP